MTDSDLVLKTVTEERLNLARAFVHKLPPAERKSCEEVAEQIRAMIKGKHPLGATFAVALVNAELEWLPFKNV